MAFFYSGEVATAQNFLSWKFNDRYFSTGIGTGWTAYFGELNNGKVFGNGLRNVSVNVEARLYNRFSARIEASLYRISGSDKNAADSTFERQRNLSFDSRNLQLSLSGVYHLFPYRGSYVKRRTYEPFLTLGVGLTRFNPKAQLGDREIELRDLKTEGQRYGDYAIIIPLGLGVRASITEFIDMSFEATYHYALTDYLDDVSSTYANNIFGDARTLSDRRREVGNINDEAFNTNTRGNEDNRDSYLIVQFKLHLYLPPAIFKKDKKKNSIIKKPSAY